MLVRGSVLVATLLALTACGATPSGDETGRSLRAARATPASGTHRVVCPVRSAQGVVRLGLDLPRGFLPGERRCTWHQPVQVPDSAGAFSSDVYLSVAPATGKASVQAIYDEHLPNAVTGDDFEGDDSILHLQLTHDVAALGSARGDRLSYLCYCDGQNLLVRHAQADGVLVSWQADLALRRETDAQLEAVLRSAGVAP